MCFIWITGIKTFVNHRKLNVIFICKAALQPNPKQRYRHSTEATKQLLLHPLGAAAAVRGSLGEGHRPISTHCHYFAGTDLRASMPGPASIGSHCQSHLLLCPSLCPVLPSSLLEGAYRWWWCHLLPTGPASHPLGTGPTLAVNLTAGDGSA